MLGALNWHRKDASIFTIAQKRHIKNVQSILGFPLNRPYQHLSAQMQDWHYTEFQTALTIAWLITGQGRNATSATTASLKAISDRVDKSENYLTGRKEIFTALDLLGLDHYQKFSPPTDWAPLESTSGGGPLNNSAAFAQLSQKLLDLRVNNAPEMSHVPLTSTSPFKIK
ncbi:hypothetical protein [Stenotrophomonas maltophilia]|uniref:hypothetical protein n=1 Tax=Stenotrophomonas maltophilia TaxID=40324 RepID=UPI00209AF219|nr:hypothetical protein [Stenotrophomonas maltophilia]MCO7496879.1 hypothetical protein [Stenotrophomonas maltophilia]